LKGGAVKKLFTERPEKPDGLSRREALQRLGGGVAAVMVLPGSLKPGLRQDASVRLRDLPSFPLSKEEGMPRALHASALLNDHRLLLTGGYYNGPLSSAEIFEPETGRWLEAASLSLPRFHHAATRLNDGRVLVIGGLFNEPLSGSEIYDPATDTWTEAAPLDMPRFQHSAVTLPTGHVVVTGGFYNGTLSGAVVYDPAADRWNAL